MSDRDTAWDAATIRDLRARLGLTQQGLADEMGVRQQTVSEWETGMYRPRGTARRLLGIIAEQAPARYQVQPEDLTPSEPDPDVDSYSPIPPEDTARLSEDGS